jgi:hypothetical protein
MKFMRDYIEFRKRTKPIRDDFDLDIIPDDGLGRFLPNRLNELTQYCIDHPQYHIMSMMPSAVKVNRALPAARFYLLAEGDTDPDLWYCDSACQRVFIYSEIRKFDRSE